MSPSITNGQFTIPAGKSGVALLMGLPSGAGQQASIYSLVTKKSNSQPMYIGGPQSATPLSGSGYELQPQESVQLTVAHGQTLYVYGQAGDVLCWLLTNPT